MKAALTALSSAASRTGTKGVIVSVKDSDPNLLKYLDKIGATPGKKIEVIGREDYDESLEIALEKKKFFVSREVSQNIMVGLKA